MIQTAFEFCFYNLNMFIVPLGAATSSSFGKGAGLVHFSNFDCSGNEINITSCTHYTSLCADSYYAGVKCQGTITCILLHITYKLTHSSLY